MHNNHHTPPALDVQNDARLDKDWLKIGCAPDNLTQTPGFSARQFPVGVANANASLQLAFAVQCCEALTVWMFLGFFRMNSGSISTTKAKQLEIKSN